MKMPRRTEYRTNTALGWQPVGRAPRVVAKNCFVQFLWLEIESGRCVGSVAIKSVCVSAFLFFHFRFHDLRKGQLLVNARVH